MDGSLAALREPGTEAQPWPGPADPRTGIFARGASRWLSLGSDVPSVNRVKTPAPFAHPTAAAAAPDGRSCAELTWCAPTVSAVTMPKPSKYIENKSHILFDMYRELSDIKASKALKEGDTSVVRDPQRV